MAGYVFTPFSVAGFDSTIVWDIDGRGNLAGFVNGATGSQGFVRVDGQLELLAGPAGAVSSAVRGLNDGGLVLGSWQDAGSVRRGFVRENGVYTSFAAPFAAAGDTDAWALSPNGRWVLAQWTPASGATRPFLWDRQTSQSILLPTLNGLVRDVNDHGQVLASVGSTSWLYSAADPATGWVALPANAGARSFLDTQRLAGVGNFDGVAQAWIGPIGARQPVAPLPAPPAGATWEMRVANVAGELVLRSFEITPDGTRFLHLVGTPAALPAAIDAPGSFRFDIPVLAGVPVFLDPEVAIGYRYRIGEGNPLFASVRLPDGIGDGRYELRVGSQSFAVLAGQVVDFAALGFAGGVAGFEVRGIEPEAQLDPANPQAFVTRVTFAGDGRFTGTQVALTTVYPPVPEPASAWLLLAGGLLLAGLRRRGA